MTDLVDPISCQDVATKGYMGSQCSYRVEKTGDIMSGSVAMGGCKITDLADSILHKNVCRWSGLRTEDEEW